MSIDRPEPLDTLARASTPEGLIFELRLAGPYPRALAFALDCLVQAGVVLGVNVLIYSTIGASEWLLLLTVFLVQWFYGAALEGCFSGRTVGKRALGLQVVSVAGTPAGAAAVLLRNLLRAADMLYFFFLIGLAVMGASRNFQRLGDLAAGTIVIHRPPRGRRTGHHALEPGVVPQAPPVRLDSAQSRAIISFAQRRHLFSEPRARALALSALEGLYGADRQFADPVGQMLSLAAWLAGHRRATEEAR